MSRQHTSATCWSAGETKLLTDTAGDEHRLRYVRIYVTVNSIEREYFYGDEVRKQYAAAAESPSSKELAMANATFVDLMRPGMSKERLVVESDGASASQRPLRAAIAQTSRSPQLHCCKGVSRSNLRNART